MLEKYKVVYKGGQDEIIEKKSRFIATVAPVESEEKALAFIEAMKKKYWDAMKNYDNDLEKIAECTGMRAALSR